MDDAEPELTDVQKAYNVAQAEMFQLAAYGHHRYHPLVESLTDEGKRQERDYNNRLLQARDDLEAALLRLVAEHATTFHEGRAVTADWLRTLADDPAELSLLALRPDERAETREMAAAWDTEPRCPNCAARRVIVRLRRWPWRRAQWWRCHACFTKFQSKEV